MIIIVSYIQCVLNARKMDMRTMIAKRIFQRNIFFVCQGYFVAISQFYLPLYLVHIISTTSIVSVIALDYIIDGKTIPK